MKIRIVLALALLLSLLPVAAYAQAGKPILTVRSYTVTPSPVKAGQEFTVELEIYNNGSRAGENTMAVFSGGDFLPVGEAGHVLWQLHINHTVRVSQTMRAPETLSAGVHQLRVDLSANDYEGNHFDYPHAIPVEVIPTANHAVSTPPKVVIESAATDPDLLVPGKPFTLTLRLANRGDRTATDLFAGCADGGLTVPLEGGNLTLVDRIGAGRVATVTMPLMLSWDIAQGGRLPMTIDLEYHDTGGGSYHDAQTIGIEVDAGLVPSPQIIVERYVADPAVPVAGEPFTITVSLQNVGSETARRLSLTFGHQDGAGLAPFMMIDTGHIVYLGELDPGCTVEIVRHLNVDQAAVPQAHNLPLTLSYTDSKSRSMVTSHSLDLVVRARSVRSPQLIITAYNTTPESVTPGDPMTLTLEIANVGSADAHGLLLSLGGQDGSALEPFMSVGSGNALFVGDLEQGETAQIVQSLIVDGAAQAGAYNLPVALSHDGMDGTPTTKVQRISLLVSRRIELGVQVYSRPESMAIDTPARLSLEVRNVGRSAVDVVGLQATGLNVALETEGTPFVGPLDAGGSAPLDLILTPTQAGTIQVTVHVTYRDELNRAQIWSQSQSFEVGGNQPVAAGGQLPAHQSPAPSTPTLWTKVLQVLKGFLGLGS